MFDDVDFHDPIILAGIGSFTLGLLLLGGLAVVLAWNTPVFQALRPRLQRARTSFGLAARSSGSTAGAPKVL